MSDANSQNELERPHEEIEITAQRHAWVTALSALTAIIEDENASRMFRSSAEPIARTLEIDLDIPEEERVTEVLPDERGAGERR